MDNSRMISKSSIYIPRMSIGWDEEAIRDIMEINRIGTVSYVDFISINKKQRFSEEIDMFVKSAFVHFSDPIFCRRTGELRSNYHFIYDGYGTGNKNFWDTIQEGKTYKIKLPSHEYWLCLKNKNPIQRTMMNIPPVVENGRHIEQLVLKQSEEIKKLKELIEKQRETINRMKEVSIQ